MTETLFQSLTNLRDDLTGLSQELGSPLYREVTIVHRELTGGSFVPLITQTTLSPNPKVMTVSPRLVGHILSDSVVVGKDDLQLTVSRNVPASLMTEHVDCWLVGGKRFLLIGIDDRKSLSWSVLLRREVETR